MMGRCGAVMGRCRYGLSPAGGGRRGSERFWLRRRQIETAGGGTEAGEELTSASKVLGGGVGGLTNQRLGLGETHHLCTNSRVDAWKHNRGEGDKG